MAAFDASSSVKEATDTEVGCLSTTAFQIEVNGSNAQGHRLTLFGERRSGLRGVSDASEEECFGRGTHNEGCSLCNFRATRIDDDFQRQSMGTDFDTLINED